MEKKTREQIEKERQEYLDKFMYKLRVLLDHAPAFEITEEPPGSYLPTPITITIKVWKPEEEKNETRNNSLQDTRLSSSQEEH